jgi:hypothetical protein
MGSYFPKEIASVSRPREDLSLTIATYNAGKSDRVSGIKESSFRVLSYGRKGNMKSNSFSFRCSPTFYCVCRKNELCFSFLGNFVAVAIKKLEFGSF